MRLDAAIAAARAESCERGIGASLTRARVLASIERSPRRRLHAVVAAVIASMFGASAFAWYAKPAPAPAPPVALHEQAPAVVNEPVPTVERKVTRVAPVVSIEKAPIEAAIERPAPPPTAPVAPPVAIPEAAQADTELALYASAHQLHFRERNMIAALDAWNQYLAAAPDGRLAPEARFNRLVALVKLERWADAGAQLEALGDSTFRRADLDKLRKLVDARRPR